MHFERVLRRHNERGTEKHFATIFDALVIPTDADDLSVPSFCTTEFGRAVEFAKHAHNSSAEATLRSWASELGLPLEEIVQIDLEDEE